LALALLGTATGTSDQSSGSTLGNHLGQQRGGTDRIVVAGNRVVDLVRVTVGIENRDHRDAELAGLADGDVFLLGVDDPDGTGDPRHVTDTAERALQLGLLPGQGQDLALGQPLESTGALLRLEL